MLSMYGAPQMTDVVVRPSGIEGLGLFVARAFTRGERIHEINVVREITSDDPLRPEAGERADYCDYPDGQVVLLGFPDRHVNHSCDPNAFVAYTGTHAAIVARRDIPSGTEITIDYNVNISDGTAWPCHCGASRCTGTVVGDFFLLPSERQIEYLPLLADWFIRRHRERLVNLLPGGATS